ncbi:MAG: hypothetical protein K2O00_05260 [Muribaculaceae bacterium]|nr:hypothetical protein [Muribaculaceae bacterium]
MKKSIFLLPFIAAWLIFATACVDDLSDSYTYRQSNIDTDEIVEAVNEAFAEAFENARLNDTILNCTIQDTDSVMILSSSQLTPAVVPNMPELKINVMTNDSEWIELQSDKLSARSTIAILSIIIPCLMIVVIAALFLLFFYFRMRNRNKVIEAAIAAGYQLPVEFYTNSSAGTQTSAEKTAIAEVGSVPPPLPRDERLRVRGLRLVAIGLGLMIMLGVWGGVDAAVLGIIPLLIGASSLASYYNILK